MSSQELSPKAKEILAAQDPALLREATGPKDPPADEDDLDRRMPRGPLSGDPARDDADLDGLSQEAREIVFAQRYGTPPPAPPPASGAVPASIPATAAGTPRPTTSRPSSSHAPAVALPSPGSSDRAKALAELGRKRGRPVMLKAMNDAEREEDRIRTAAALAEVNARRSI